ncbi:SMI1/KNR4 family protein [Streptomyces griseorubiginosus]|uniref:SMI1/KNR4 family protein n=1 Tax=Streptomyces griseorubiginosus TaxID=67304 RepID=UPI00368D6C27
MPQVDEVVSAWERIVRWLRNHAPASAEALRPGATDEEISRLNEGLGFEIPDVLEAWLRLNNGSTSKDRTESLPGGGRRIYPHIDSLVLPGNYAFRSCEEIWNKYRFYLSSAEDLGDDGYWKPSWIPVAEAFDSPDGIIVVGEDPAGATPLLRFAEYYHPSPYLPSLSGYLASVADLLEHGEAPGTAMERQRFDVVDGRLEWK